MFKFFRRHRTVVMGFMAACIGGLLLFGVGGTGILPSPQDTILKVNGTKVTQAQFDQFHHQLSRRKESPTAQDRIQLNQQALQELIRQEVFYQEAKKYGLATTDQELQLELAAISAFQKDGRFDGTTYVQTIRQMFGMTPRQFEKGHKKDLIGRKLNQLLVTSVHVSETDLKAALEQRLKTETDKAKIKEWKENPEKLRDELKDRELNLVFNDFLNQLNASLKVNITSDRFRSSLTAGQPQ